MPLANPPKYRRTPWRQAALLSIRAQNNPRGPRNDPSRSPRRDNPNRTAASSGKRSFGDARPMVDLGHRRLAGAASLTALRDGLFKIGAEIVRERPVDHLPDGRGRGAACVVPVGPGSNRGAVSIAAGAMPRPPAHTGPTWLSAGNVRPNAGVTTQVPIRSAINDQPAGFHLTSGPFRPVALSPCRPVAVAERPERG